MRIASCPDKSLLREHLDGIAHGRGRGRGGLASRRLRAMSPELLETLAAGGEPWLAVARGLGEEPPVPAPSWAEVTLGLDRVVRRLTAPELGSLLTLLGLADDGGPLGRLDHYRSARSSARAAWGWSSRASTRSSSGSSRSRCCRPYWAARPDGPAAVPPRGAGGRGDSRRARRRRPRRRGMPRAPLPGHGIHPGRLAPGSARPRRARCRSRKSSGSGGRSLSAWPPRMPTA